MKPFAYERPTKVGGALSTAAGAPGAKYLAGGTNLVDLMKNGVEVPVRLIDINRLPLARIVALPDGGLRLGAVARNSDTADHPLVRRRYPLLAEALLAGASPQLRNMASNGGNLLQRTRCAYFMDVGLAHCNKRLPGSGCGALQNPQRNHAILGASNHCIATHPSDMAVALVALEAVVRIQGPQGERTLPVADLYRLPGDHPELDTTLRQDELIVSIDLPPSPYGLHYHYIKVRDRASYDFALVSTAVALELHGLRIRSARIALGGVAHKPWRALAAEQLLVGRDIGPVSWRAAADAALGGAHPQPQNAFKVELCRRAIIAALSHAAGPI
jgi:xanthine dehydrogenase YagS FAD-binding subunit